MRKFSISKENICPILRRPENLFKKTKEIVLRKIALGDRAPEKVKLKEALEDCPKEKLYCQDSNLTETLLELFEGNEEASFEVQFDFRKEPLFGLSGEFILPRTIIANGVVRELHCSCPQIQILSFKDPRAKEILSKLKKDLERNESIAARKHEALSAFREIVLSIKSFGTISVCPAECTSNDGTLSMQTLDETIEDSCLRLKAFLLSIAKTCSYYEII